MINSTEVYFQVGAKSGKALRQRDFTTSRFHHDWFRRARALETHANQRTAAEHFNAGYRSETVPIATR
jgi:hypothetical protein